VVNYFVLGGKGWEILFGKNISFSNNKKPMWILPSTQEKLKRKCVGAIRLVNFQQKEEGDFSFHLKSWSSLSH